MNKLSVGVSVAAAIATLGLISPAQAANNDITIGFAIAQSGWMNAYDGPPLKGAQMAIDDINAKGGVLGRKLKAVIADTKSDQTQGARAGQEVLSDGAQFMVVSCDYDMGAGAATVANSKHIIAISFCASDAKMGVQGIGPYAFTMSTSSLTDGAAMAEWAWTKKKWRNAYVLLDTSIEYDKAICGGFKTRWKKLGGKLLGDDTFKQDDSSIASQITRIQQTNASHKIDFLMVCSYDGGAVSAIRQIRSAGIMTPLGGGDSMDGDYWAKGIPHLSDSYCATYGSAFGDDPRPAYNDFMSRIAKYNGGERLPTSFGINGYSVVEAFALAIKRAGTTDSDKVLAQMNKFKDEALAVGPTTFTPNLHINLMRPVAIMGIKDGKGYFVDLIKLPEPPPLQLIFKS